MIVQIINVILPNHAPNINLIPLSYAKYKFSRFTLDITFKIPLDALVNLTRTYQLEEVIKIVLYLTEGDGGPIYTPGAILFASLKSEIPHGEIIEYPSFIFEIVKDI